MKKAVILAAGKGTRIGAFDKGEPKCLTRFLGLPIIERTIKNLEQAGIQEIIIVTGFAQDILLRHLSKIETKCRLQTVHNSEWEKSNGVSLLAAEHIVADERFILIMSDHLFEPEILNKLLKQPITEDSYLCIDSRVEEIFDIEDATKVKVVNSQIVKIGKEIQDFNAVDTGVFLLHPLFVKTLREIYQQKGDCSITEGVRAMINKGFMKAVDVTGLFWMDIDTKKDLAEARRRFIKKFLYKPTDGIISRRLNRPVSTFISTRLARFKINPNLMTLFSAVVGILSAWFVSRGNYLSVAAGGLLYQAASVIDGIDGELAKMLYKNSRTGEWLDTFADNLTYVAFTFGLMWAAWRIHGEAGLVTGAFATVGVILFLVFSYAKLIREKSGGSLLAIHANPRGFWQSLLRRDFFAFLFMWLSLLHQVFLMTALTAAGAWAGVIWHIRELTKK